jgi:iodotyrosine deiodinase
MKSQATTAFPTIPYQRERISEEAMRAAAQRFLEVAQFRRSVRAFSPDPVPTEVIRLAVEAASTAPSGANMQPWKFVVVTDPQIKHDIRIGAEKEEKENYEGRMPDEWLRALAPLQTDWHKDFLEIAPVLIVVFKEDYHEENGRKVRHYYVAESVGIACGMLLAALNEAGLATLTHTPSPMNFLREILGRPQQEKPYLLIPVGYPAPDCRVPDIRKKHLTEVLVEI